MKTLILHRGMDKTAAGEEGPSLEQQFGLITNSKIVEKFPRLDNMKLAFQVIEKNDEATNAVGVMAYLIGKCVVYVPSIFRNGEVNTGDIMFVAQTQQFLPMSDPWLAWLKSKGVADVAELVPKDSPRPKGGPGDALTTDYTTPIGKKASVLNEPGMTDLLDMASAYVKSIGRLQPDGKHDTPSITDMALSMGSDATGTLCEEMSKSAKDLNMFLAFYSPEQLDEFEKKASAAFCVEPETDSLVLPFTEEAKALPATAQTQLQEVGWFVKRAEESSPVKPVMKEVPASKLFSTLNRTGKTEILTSKGVTKTVVALRGREDKFSRMGGPMFIVDGDTAYKVPDGTVELTGTHEDFTADMLYSLGNKFTGAMDPEKDPEFEHILAFPDGSCLPVYCDRVLKSAYISGFGIGLHALVLVGEDDAQVAPIVLGADTKDPVCVVPKNTRIIKSSFKRPEADGRIITNSLLPSMMDRFTKIRYNKVKVLGTNGTQSVSGDKTASAPGASEADCALILVRDYGISNKDAKTILKNAALESKGKSVSTTYLIEKTAAEIDSDPSIGYTALQNEGPTVEKKDMPEFVDDPNKLKNDMNTAVQNGIKEVFDVTTLKLLVKKTKFFDDIKESVPLYMQTLDSLCRRLFQFYWHTDKMEKKYGMSKLKKLEEAIKSAIDTLSELTIFFKLRTVDGTGSTGDSATELLGGKML